MPKNLCPEIRGRIIGQWQAGRTVAQIAAAIPCSEKTVRRWIQRFTKGGDHALRDHRRNNRGPRKTRTEEDKRIIAAIVEQPFGTVQEAVNAANVQVSERTARRRLNEAGYRCHRPKIPKFSRKERIALENLTTNREGCEATTCTNEKVFVSPINSQFHIWTNKSKVGSKPCGARRALGSSKTGKTYGTSKKGKISKNCCKQE